MLTPSERRVWIVTSLIVVAFTVPQCAEFVASPLYEIAEGANKQQQQEEAAYNIFAVMLRLNEFFTVFEKLFLVVSTVAIAFFTYTLWRATTGLFRMAEGQADDMTESLDIAKRSADAATESAKLARSDFASTHRPKLIVRRIRFKSECMIAYEVANIGAASAENIDAKSAVYLDKIPVGIPGALTPVFIGAKNILGGTYFEFIHGIADNDLIKNFATRRGHVKAHGHDVGKPIYFLGEITYSDSYGVGRRTAFYRIYDFATERFMPIPNADQDYEHVD